MSHYHFLMLLFQLYFYFYYYYYLFILVGKVNEFIKNNTYTNYFLSHNSTLFTVIMGIIIILCIFSYFFVLSKKLKFYLTVCAIHIQSFFFHSYVLLLLIIIIVLDIRLVSYFNFMYFYFGYFPVITFCRLSNVVYLKILEKKICYYYI